MSGGVSGRDVALEKVDDRRGRSSSSLPVSKTNFTPVGDATSREALTASSNTVVYL